MIVEDEKDDLVSGIKKITEINTSPTIHQETVFDALYIILEGGVEIPLPCDGDHLKRY